MSDRAPRVVICTPQRVPMTILFALGAAAVILATEAKLAMLSEEGGGTTA